MTDMMRKEDNNFEALEQVLADGNLQALTAEQRCLRHVLTSFVSSMACR